MYMYTTLMIITIINQHNCIISIQYLYDNLLLPQSLLLQPHFDDFILLLYLSQHINIVTYQ